MRKAILCFAHKDAYVLKTLIRQSLHGTDGETDIYIHLDKKSEQLKSEIEENPHVFFIKNNVSVTWGDDTMMKALRQSFDEIRSYGKEYDYFVMCTGQDIWVKPGIDQYLEENEGKIWLDAEKKDERYRMLLQTKFPHKLCRYMSDIPVYYPIRIYRHLFYRLMYKGLVPRKKINYDLSKVTFYFSFNWSMMPYEVFLYIDDFMKSETEFMKLYEDTYLPEDGFLGTIVMNSPYAKNVVFKDDNREVRSTSPTFWGHKEDILSVCQHMYVLKQEDKDEIAESGCWMARKFDSKMDKGIVDYYSDLVTQRIEK